MNPISQPEHRVAIAGGIELAYDSFGDPNDEPLLLIMGLGSQMLVWDDGFCAALAARGFHVVRFDNRDVGRSTVLAAAGIPDIGAMMKSALAGEAVTAPYTLADMAADATGLLDALGIASAHIVGASMGGAIAQEIAMSHPARVRTLVSIMASSGDPGLPPPKPEAMAVLFTPAPLEQPPYVERYRKVWKVLRVGAFPEDEAVDAARAARMHARGVHPAGTARQLAAVLASGSRKARLASLRTPTLVIHGDVDPLVPLEHGVDVANTVPGAKLEILKGMGHALPIAMWPRLVDSIATHARSA